MLLTPFVLLVLIVDYARARSGNRANARALTSARQRANGGSARRADTHTLGGVHMAAMAYGISAPSAFPRPSLRCIVSSRVPHRSRIGINCHAQKHSGRQHDSK